MIANSDAELRKRQKEKKNEKNGLTSNYEKTEIIVVRKRQTKFVSINLVTADENTFLNNLLYYVVLHT